MTAVLLASRRRVQAVRRRRHVQAYATGCCSSRPGEPGRAWTWRSVRTVPLVDALLRGDPPAGTPTATRATPRRGRRGSCRRTATGEARRDRRHTCATASCTNLAAWQSGLPRPTAGVRPRPPAAARARPRSSRATRAPLRRARRARRPDRGHRAGGRDQPGDRLPALHRQGGAVRAHPGRLPRRAARRARPRPTRRGGDAARPADRAHRRRSSTTASRTRRSSTARRR